MNSCFPPLAALSLHGSTPASKPPAGSAPPASRIEVLQDLDLYYIKQIAHNLKVRGLKNSITGSPISF
ncbi:Rhotekin [Nesidiocoris tenuis]|uniref:Rhotekin n=1 Tax=Nesidiocoris tenuis TaxID=355587 RepID=A0ABN7B4G4_9HEMI|nr:Rhotekin [Nesidiocoris tenuis]